MQKMLKSFDPSNGKFIGQVEITGVSEITTIVEKSKTAQKKLVALTFDERVNYIKKAGDLLTFKYEVLGELLSRERGKTLNSWNELSWWL